MIKNKLKNNKGFTLVEAMFAVLILSFVIVGMMTVVANDLFSARYARDEITANYLAQEVVDYIRNDRDTTVFWSDAVGRWNTFVSHYSICTSGNPCHIDVLVLNNNIISSGGGPLYYDATATNNSFYNYDTTVTGSVESKFTRKVIVTSAPDGNSIDVTVTVSWKNGNSDKTRVMTATLMNWTE